ncbi:MAG: glycosyl hydrolase 115 family protein [Lachnotalea sp.]
MEQYFKINQNTVVETESKIDAVDQAVFRLKRDLKMTLSDTKENGGKIYLVQEEIIIECFHIYFDEQDMYIGAKDDLGFIYGLLYISKEYLGVLPFWFWNDQIFEKKMEILISKKEYMSTPAKVHFRGWFVNDEVLISHWEINNDMDKPWEMVFEALLRCGGNIVIPGTDKNSKKYKDLAASMGLWITHHHAEPLGAKMFARVYPELSPSYAKYPELFQELWNNAIKEQMGQKTIWNLGFRGQGDVPFWENDPQYSTPQSRGELISSLIKLQYDMVCEKISNPICCTNLYGEVMELYNQGYIKLPGQVIKIWADNGYGKMVSRRQGNNNSRVYALPDQDQKSGKHGIYYHASFYDLQAANHITMLPNSIEFVNNELNNVIDKGADDFWVVNCSNVKPHVYTLDAISQIWNDGRINVEKWSLNYIKNYYSNKQNEFNKPESSLLFEQIENCYSKYYQCTVAFGDEVDEHAGEQFYNYTVRILASQWLISKYEESVNELHWATGDIKFENQVKWFYNICVKGEQSFEQLYQNCINISEQLVDNAKICFEDSIMLQVKIHLYCLKGAVKFCEGFNKFKINEFKDAFYLIGQAKENFAKGNLSMREREHDKWKGFYQHDCLCDIKQTAYVLRSIMSYIRTLGDGPHFYTWQREFLYSEEDRKVLLITNMENHITDEELYLCMKSKFDTATI